MGASKGRARQQGEAPHVPASLVCGGPRHLRSSGWEMALGGRSCLPGAGPEPLAAGGGLGRSAWPSRAPRRPRRSPSGETLGKEPAGSGASPSPAPRWFFPLTTERVRVKLGLDRWLLPRYGGCLQPFRFLGLF